MGTTYLVDTNLCIYFLDGVLPIHSLTFMRTVLNEDNYSLSVITKIELLGWQFPDISKAEYSTLFVNNSIIVPLNNEVVEQTIALRKSHKIKLPDAIIAATAIVFDLTLISRNDKDFKQISSLKYINPFG